MKEIIIDYEKLSTRSDEIDIRKENSTMREIVASLKEVVRAKQLKGLAAPQIGYNKRIFVINYKGDIRTYINPIITKAKGFQLSKEGCPSIPDKVFIRPRNNEIEVTFQTPLGKILSQKLLGLSAIVFQELLDHLDGLLLNDIGLEIDNDFEQASDEEREQVIDAYLDTLDIAHKHAEKEIESNPELKQMDDAVKFMHAVQRGEVELKEEKPYIEQKES